MDALLTYAFAHWTEWLFSALFAFLAWSNRRMTKRMQNQKEEERKRREKDEAENLALRNGMQALLRDRIIQAYNHYHEKGYCPIYGKENVKRMYDSYHALDGNDVATGLVEKILAMPEELEERED